MKKIYCIIAVISLFNINCIAQDNDKFMEEFITPLNTIKNDGDKIEIMEMIVNLQKFVMESDYYSTVLQKNTQSFKNKKYCSNHQHVEDIENILTELYDMSFQWGFKDDVVSATYFEKVCDKIDDCIANYARMRSAFMRLPM